MIMRTRDAASVLEDLEPPSIAEARGDVVNPDDVINGATALVPGSPLIAADTVVTLYLYGEAVGGGTVSYEAAQQVFDTTMFPLVFVVPAETIALLRDASFNLDYQVQIFQDDGSIDQPFSPPRTYRVRVLALPLPKVIEAQGKWLDPAAVDARTGARVLLDWSDQAFDDRGTMTWTGSATGTFVTQFTVRQIAPLLIAVPKDPHVTGNEGGTVTVSYAVTFATGGQATSPVLTLSVGAAVGDLPAPVVDAATSGFLDPLEVHYGVEARLPAEVVLEPGDVVRLYVGDYEIEGTPPTFFVSAGTIGRLLGADVTVRYELERGGVVHESAVLPLQVGRIENEDARLPRPAIEEATGRTIDLATFTGDATVKCAAWPLATAGQYVWLEVHGTASGGSKVVRLLAEHELSAEEAAYGLTVRLPRDELEAFDGDSTITVKLWVGFDGSPYQQTAVLLRQSFYTMVASVAPGITRVVDRWGDVLTHGGSTTSGAVTLSGTAAPNKQVQIWRDGAALTTVTADANGHWTTASTTLTEGVHHFQAKALYGSQPTSPVWTVTAQRRAPIDFDHMAPGFYPPDPQVGPTPGGWIRVFTQTGLSNIEVVGPTVAVPSAPPYFTGRWLRIPSIAAVEMGLRVPLTYARFAMRTLNVTGNMNIDLYHQLDWVGKFTVTVSPTPTWVEIRHPRAFLMIRLDCTALGVAFLDNVTGS